MPDSSQQYLSLDEILVIIPVLNEEASLAGVIQALQTQGLNHIRVIDNGSTDHSASIAQANHAEVVSEPIPGYGQACWRGLQNLPDSIQWILFCDGDGSDDLTQLPHFFHAALDADFILADRRTDPQSRSALTLAQNVGNGLAVHLIHMGWGYQYQDLGPLRLIRRSALDAMQMEDRSFGWTIEMQVKAIEQHLKIQEIPTVYRHRQGGTSKISGTVSGVVKAGIGILSTLAKFYIQRWQRHSPSLLIILSAAFLLLGCLIALPHGGFDSTPSFHAFGWGIGCMGVGFYGSWLIRTISARWFWAVTILARLLLLPMQPGDDVWRYLWEGYLQTQGISPYVLPPNAEALMPYRLDWWPFINHPETSAIYPPVAQTGFHLIALMSLTVLAFKIAFVLADLGICWLLSRRYGYPKTLLYAWNPLIIYSFAGGAHFDSWFLLPLVLAWLLADRHRSRLSALGIGISIGVKWISLPLLTFLGWQTMQRKQWLRAFSLFGFASLPLFMTFPAFCTLQECPLIPVQSSFVTTSRSAELIPYLAHRIWPVASQQNWVFALPLMGALVGLLGRFKTFASFCEGYFLVLLSLSPIVHAWYFTWLIPFAVTTRNLGTRLFSLSGFVYFVLPYRRFALNDWSWHLTGVERALLWFPVILAFHGLFSSRPYQKLSSPRETDDISHSSSTM